MCPTYGFILQASPHLFNTCASVLVVVVLVYICADIFIFYGGTIYAISLGSQFNKPNKKPVNVSIFIVPMYTQQTLGSLNNEHLKILYIFTKGWKV